MTAREARLVIGAERGTQFEQHLIAAMRVASWPDLQHLASGWPDLVNVFLLYQERPEQVRLMARRH
jgi:hypothetical protein